MLVPKRDAKHYGAVYVDNYMDYIGFCKKVESDDAQNVDVFIDGNKIDTILADKNIPKISQIYDIEGFGFSYELPEIYLDKPHTISFKASDSSEELLNSPIGIIHKNHPKFNEYKFLNSLSKPIDEEKIKDMYCPNSIGFLATEENLADEEFVGYIKELMVRFPEVEFKGFCFNEKQKKLLEKIFSNSKIFFLILKDFFTLFNNIEIYLCNASATEELTKYYKIQNIIRTSSSNFLVAYYDKSKNKLIKELQNSINFQEHPYVKFFDFFGYAEKDIANANTNIYSLIWDTILKRLKINNLDIENLTGNELMFVKHIELALKYPEYKQYFFNLYSKEELKRNG